MDLLASQWLSGVQSTETRLYLVENILPTLIVGLEKLLQKVDEGADEDFNSINWLAQWLTRCVGLFLRSNSETILVSSKHLSRHTQSL